MITNAQLKGSQSILLDDDDDDDDDDDAWPSFTCSLVGVIILISKLLINQSIVV